MAWPVAGQEVSPVTEAARKASIRRQEDLSNVQRLMLEGDRRLADEDRAGAYETYRRAFQEAPVHAAGRQIRMLAFSKYQEALRQYADEMARQGRMNEAHDLVQEFYRDAQRSMVPPSAIDRKTALLFEDLKGSGVYEPAQSPKNLERVERVQELFILADSAAQLGRYDEATMHYAEILNYDPYNKAARRGMENVDKLINAYNQAAYDSTRATMLTDVSAMWENPVPRMGLSALADTSFRELNPTEANSIRSKLTSIVLPDVEFVGTPLRDALFFLSQRSKQIDPTGAGVDIILSNAQGNASNAPITLRLKDVPLGTVLDYTTQLARMKYRVDQYAITVVPLTAPDDEQLITKRYRVPPDFISGGALGGGDDPFGGNADPFADLGGGGGGGGALQPKLTAKEFLTNNGIQFAEGGTATFFPETSTLLVRNTLTQLDLIETLIDASYGNVAQLLKFDVKVLEVTETRLAEIGFDWLLGQFNVGDSNRVFAGGGTEGNASSGGTTSNDFPFSAPGATTPVGENPLTAGNRSGGALPNTLDNLLANGSTASNASSTGKAPGTLALAGVFTDPQFQVVLRSLNQARGVDIASNMSVLTRAGQIASAKAVREFIYPTEYDPPEIPDDVFASVSIGGIGGSGQSPVPVTPATPTAFEMRELGSIVEVEGAIGPDGETISVTLNPEVIEFQGFINYGSPYQQVGIGGETTVATTNEILMPIFRTLRNTTSVEVYDGHTIAIGGLRQERRAMIQDRVPILGDVPVLGKLFSSNIEENERQAVIFFVTVSVVDPSGTPIKEAIQASL
tara:strand:+ start:6715 stop:9108 length:2394 start_codon:yes stop_codon:yes gene_type:complete